MKLSFIFSSNGSNASLIKDTQYNWASFVTPKFEDFLICQLQVGTFVGYNDDFAKEIEQSNEKVAKYRHIQAKLGYIKEMGFSAI